MDSLLPTDLLLLRCRLATAGGLAPAAQALCDAVPGGATLKRLAWSAADGWAYAYLRPAAPQPLPASVLAPLAQRWLALCPQAQATDVARLQCVLDLQGASAGGVPASHYVVETDPRAGWDDEIARWYADEHLPGLAAVPGCILAQRYANHDSGPRSLACYDLVSEAVLGTPAWLAVRETAWSDRARPHFTNTRRTRMAVVA